MRDARIMFASRGEYGRDENNGPPRSAVECKWYLKGDRFLRCCLYRFALHSLLIRRATFCKRPPDHSVLDRQAWSTTCPFSRERMREHLGTVNSPGLFHLGRHRRRSSQHREREEAVTVDGLLLPVDYFESNTLVKDDIALLVRA